uniref:Uncharacterized protein n=1 Tax=Oryza brachyantha TaxID=4533 RepID=J3LXU6_ORYBR
MKMLLLCCSLAVVLQPSRALFDLRGASVSLQLRAAAGGGGGYGEEKVPMTVVVPDYSPRPAPFGRGDGHPASSQDGAAARPSSRHDAVLLGSLIVRSPNHAFVKTVNPMHFIRLVFHGIPIWFLKC